MAEKINLTFLGTGSAIPTARRNHPAVYLQYMTENILMDCGEGTQRQFRKARLNPCRINRILITHWHGDHTLGLPGLFQTLMLNGYNGKLQIYGPRGTGQKVRQYLDLTANRGIKLDLEIHEVGNGTVFKGDGFHVESKEMKHSVPAVAYSFVVEEKKRLDRAKLKKLKLPNSPLMADLVKGKTVKIGGKKVDGRKLVYIEPSKKVTFVMDTKMNDNAVKLSKDSDLLICESTYSADEEKLAEDHFHLTCAGAAQIAKKAKVKKLALIHMSQRYDMIPKKILEEAKKVFKNVVVPEDLDRAEV